MESFCGKNDSVFSQLSCSKVRWKPVKNSRRSPQTTREEFTACLILNCEKNKKIKQTLEQNVCKSVKGNTNAVPLISCRGCELCRPDCCFAQLELGFFRAVSKPLLSPHPARQRTFPIPSPEPEVVCACLGAHTFSPAGSCLFCVSVCAHSPSVLWLREGKEEGQGEVVGRNRDSNV